MKLSIRLATLLVLPACASAPTPAAGPVASPATTLGYALPAPPTASYSVADSTVFDIQGGAIGDIHVSGSVKATTAVTYAQNSAGLEATMRITDFAGSVANSAMGGAGPSATEADIEGPAVVTVSPRGAATVSAMPKLTPVIQTIGLSQSFFRRFFVRLPASSVKTGAVWVDTISTTDDNGGTKAVLSDIVTSTFARDTVINGNTIAIITSSSQRTLSISGLSQGVEIAQKLTGTGTGRVLWDTERHLLVERLETSQLTGTFDLPQMGVTGLPVTARGSLRIALE